MKPPGFAGALLRLADNDAAARLDLPKSERTRTLVIATLKPDGKGYRIEITAIDVATGKRRAQESGHAKTAAGLGAAVMAAAAKITENVFRAVNIALVKELKLVFDRMGIDVWEVIDAAGTKPFGFMPFYPGPGLGGHCIPLDPFYLSWKAARHGMWTCFIALAAEINTSMPRYVVGKE